MKYNKYSKKMMKNLITGRAVLPSSKVWQKWAESLEVGDMVYFRYDGKRRLNSITEKSFKLDDKWIRKSTLNELSFRPAE